MKKQGRGNILIVGYRKQGLGAGSQSGTKVRCNRQRTYVSKDGGVHIMEIHESLIRDETGESLGVLAGGIAHDFNDLLVGIHARHES